MTYVLVHGGTFAGSCWDLMVPYLDAPAVAVDLPGRGNRPADLATVTIADFVDAVVDEIEQRDLYDVVLVGHSLAGITLPGVAARVPERLARLVFVAATVPEHGENILSSLDVETLQVAEESASAAEVMPAEDWVRASFCNDMDESLTQWTLARMGPEANGVMTEPVDLSGMSGAVARTWVMTLQDAIVSPERQQRYAERIGADVIPIDVAHMAMISRPEQLAQVICSLRARS
jgi:pimeloyl-ACP methyl ester carboxylesterase